jgi:hypothetical protein
MRLRLGLLDILSILKEAAECGNAKEDAAGHGEYGAHKCELSYFFAAPLPLPLGFTFVAFLPKPIFFAISLRAFA